MNFTLLDATIPERLKSALNALEKKQQLDFEGTYNSTSKVITFESTTPYELTNNVEYEIDLLLELSGVLPDDATMQIVVGGKTIQISNVLNYSASTPITFGQMKQVMLPYDIEEGRYRWIFDATFNEATSEVAVFSGSMEITGEDQLPNMSLPFASIPQSGWSITVNGVEYPQTAVNAIPEAYLVAVVFNSEDPEGDQAMQLLMYAADMPEPQYAGYTMLMAAPNCPLVGQTLTNIKYVSGSRVLNMPATATQPRTDIVQIVTNQQMLDAVTDGVWNGSSIVTPSDDDGYELGTNYQWNSTSHEWTALSVPVPTSLPATSGAKVSGNLPTSGWVGAGDFFSGETQIPAGNYYQATKIYDGNVDGLDESSTIKICVLKDGATAEYTLRYSSKNSIYISYRALVGNIEYYIEAYKSNSSSTSDINSLKIRTYSGNGGKLVSGFSTAIAGVQASYTITDANITANSLVTMYLKDIGGVKEHSISDGSITVIRDTVPSVAIPYEYKVVSTDKAGLFKVVNSYLPTIPAPPAALPVQYKKSTGSIPTSAWIGAGDFWNGNVITSQYAPVTVECPNMPDWTNGTLIPTTGWKVVIDGDEITPYEPSGSTSSFDLVCKAAEQNGVAQRVLVEFLFTNGRKQLRISAMESGAQGLVVSAVKNETLGIVIHTTISNADIAVNSEVKLNISAPHTISISGKHAGGIDITADTLPSAAIDYTLEITYTDTEGNASVINEYAAAAPTSLPVTYKKVSGNLPTTGWDSDTPFWTGNKLLPTNSAESVGNFDNSSIVIGSTVYFTIDGVEYNANVSVDSGTSFDLDYLISSLDIRVKIYFEKSNNGYVKVYQIAGGGNHYIQALKCAAIAGATATYTIADTAIKVNSAVKLYLNNADTVTAYAKADGSVTVQMDSVPATAIPYDMEIVDTNSEGVFEVINAYVPPVLVKSISLNDTPQTPDNNGNVNLDIPTASGGFRSIYSDATGGTTVALSEAIDPSKTYRVGISLSATIPITSCIAKINPAFNCLIFEYVISTADEGVTVVYYNLPWDDENNLHLGSMATISISTTGAVTYDGSSPSGSGLVIKSVEVLD